MQGCDSSHLTGGVVGRGPRVPRAAELAYLRLVGAVVPQHVQQVKHVACGQSFAKPVMVSISSPPNDLGKKGSQRPVQKSHTGQNALCATFLRSNEIRAQRPAGLDC